MLIGLFSALSLFLAIIRDRLLSTQVGVGPLLDVYNASFRIPDLLYAFLFALVTAGTVVPFLTEEDKNKKILDPRKKVYSLSIFFASIIGIIGGLIAVTLPLYAHLLVPGFTDLQLEQFIFATRVLLIQPFFLGLTSLISCLSQLRNEFILYGISPLGYSLSIIVSIIYLYPNHGLTGLLYGVVIGSAISLLIQSITLMKVKVFEINYKYAFSEVLDLIKLAIPRTGTNITTQIRNIFFTGLATTFGAGGLTAFLFAQRITEAINQLIQQSIITASLPILSKDYVENKRFQYLKTVKKYILILGLIGLSSAVFVYFFKDKVIYFLYGETGYNDLIGYFLTAFLIALPIHMISGYISTSLYAIKDTRSVFIIFFTGTTLSIITGLYLHDLGIVSLFASVIVWFISQFIISIYFYNKKISSLLK